ncbi:MAG: PEP-utilizing enzyme [Patescibacteria group bacterium]
MSKDIRKFELFGHRDFTMATMQIGAEGETGPLPWLDDMTLKKPYWAIERMDNRSSIFLDPAQVEWQKQEIMRRIKTDARYTSGIVVGANKSYDTIKSIIKNPRALTRKEFEVFVKDFIRTWNWLAGIWWAVEVLEDKPDYKKLVDEMMVFRKDNDIFVPNGDEVLRLSITKFYPNLIPYIGSILLEEILTDTIPSEEELKEREKHSLVLEGKIYTGEAIKKIQKELAIDVALPRPDDHQQQAGIIKGQVGYKGKYKGIVSIVLNKAQANAFQEGRVLVASQTTPDFIVAIKKSGAMITDEGGIISHAAITSRELKIPCIIGTKVATQMLKDGDMVEVDANTGIVRIIK